MPGSESLAAEAPELHAKLEEMLLGDREPDLRLDRRAEEFIDLEAGSLHSPAGAEAVRGRPAGHEAQAEEVFQAGSESARAHDRTLVYVSFSPGGR